MEDDDPERARRRRAERLLGALDLRRPHRPDWCRHGRTEFSPAATIVSET